MQQRDCYFALATVDRQGLAGTVQGRLGHAVAVVAARTVVAYRAHAAGDHGHLAARLQYRQQRLGQQQRCQRVHFELGPQLIDLLAQLPQHIAAEDAGTMDQDVQGTITHGLTYPIDPRALAELYAVDALTGQLRQRRSGIATNSDHLMTCRQIVAHQFQADAAGTAGDQNSGHVTASLFEFPCADAIGLRVKRHTRA